MQDIQQETLNECIRAEQSASVVLWEIDLTEVDGDRYFFCNEQNEKGESVTWQSRQYQAYPIQGSGFEMNGKGSAARPTLTVSMAYSRVSTFSGDYIRVTDNKGKTHDVLTGSDDGRHSNTSLAWGAGVQFNPTESVAVDVAYEGSGSGDWRTNSFIVGVGYKF
ncbi:phage minor tail protein L [Escherichia coli]